VPRIPAAPTACEPQLLSLLLAHHPGHGIRIAEIEIFELVI
jgi:hypothetical protein